MAKLSPAAEFHRRFRAAYFQRRRRQCDRRTGLHGQKVRGVEFADLGPYVQVDPAVAQDGGDEVQQYAIGFECDRDRAAGAGA